MKTEEEILEAIEAFRLTEGVFILSAKIHEARLACITRGALTWALGLREGSLFEDFFRDMQKISETITNEQRELIVGMTK